MELRGHDITFKTRQMIKIGEEIGGQYELEMGAYKGDIKLLGNLLSIASDGLTYETALDLIDELLDNGDTIKGIYEKLFAEMNNKAFFTQKLEVMETPPIDMEKYISDMMESVGTDMIAKTAEETIKTMPKASKK
jgi:hypothetical protein